MQTITINTPDDWHVHLRDGDILKYTVPATGRCFARATVMPNLVPPITTVEQALAYQDRILAVKPAQLNFQPTMTLYLTDQTTPEMIQQAAKAGLKAVKLYPAGATTHSNAGVTQIQTLTPVFEALAHADMRLLIHGEVTDKTVDIFDREKIFLDRHLHHIRTMVPTLKIVLEHITTADAAAFVAEHQDMAATITPQHLLLNRNDLLVGGIRPHFYCLPVLKRNTHQQALQAAATSGSPKFFLGTDSAPHLKQDKESACGCAGCFSSMAALELYAEVFDQLNALDRLEGFASHFGADFYGLPRNSSHITLVKSPWTVPDTIQLDQGREIIPFFAGMQLNWQLDTSGQH